MTVTLLISAKLKQLIQETDQSRDYEPESPVGGSKVCEYPPNYALCSHHSHYSHYQDRFQLEPKSHEIQE